MLQMTLASLILIASQVTQCGATDEVYSALIKIGEERQLTAQPSPDQLIEFWGGNDGWTIFVTSPNGQSCLVASGKDWQEYHGKPNL